MADLSLTTARLELVAGTARHSRAEIDDRQEFSRLLGARVPENWPPPLNDADSMEWSARYHEEHPDANGWNQWYFILLADPQGERRAIGIGGFKGKPTPDGTAEIGYSVMEDDQRHGYATEAVAGLLVWAFEHAEVRRVIAETFPELKPSIRVLEKSGFSLVAEEGSEPGVIRFELTRESFEAGRGGKP
ncbi:MAG TPA: GNAT family N-acetyltransferase [Pyrinomonadaceae bacterium]|jgi:RimJ/RimL family protein N-acetyltransferase